MDFERPKKTFKPEKKKWPIFLLSLLGVIVLTLLSIYIIRPAFIGYTVYQQLDQANIPVKDYQKTYQEMEEKLLIAQTNLSSCQSFLKEFFSQLDVYQNKISEYQSEAKLCQENFASFQNSSQKEFEKFKKDLEGKEDEIKKGKSDYAELAFNSASNLCCKAKVDDSLIDSYQVIGNKIVCTKGGSLKIYCQ